MSKASNDNLSPLLNGAMEDFEHAVEHLTWASEKDRKYAVIHAASAIELALKEALRKRGVSVFEKKPPYHSFGFYDCLNILKQNKVIIPLESDIEILHQERNICVHLAGKPDEKKTRWLIDVARNFMKEFCATEFDINISKFLPTNLMMNISNEAKKVGLSPAHIYFADAEIALHQEKFVGAVFNASAGLELLLKDYLTQRGIEPSPILHKMIESVKRERKISPFVIHEIEALRNLRNAVAHAQLQPTQKEARQAVDLARFIFESFSDLWKGERKCVICGSSDVVGTETEISADVSTIKSMGELQKRLRKYERAGKGKIAGYYCKEHEPYWIR